MKSPHHSSASPATAEAEASAWAPQAPCADLAPRTVIRGERETTTAHSGPFTDWVSVTYPLRDTSNPVRDFAALFFPVFGDAFGDLQDRRRGVHGYRQSFGFDKGGVVFAFGGQRDTAYVSFPGEGCALVRDRWTEFTALFRDILCARITRWDGAIDDYTGVHSVDDAVALYLQGAFNLTNHKPTCKQAGNWIEPDGSGRTLYIGRRRNGKLLRVYEKGKQLGMRTSPWVRWETEFHNVDRIIPWEVLQEPGRYLAGAYPALSWVHGMGSRIETIRRTDEISYEHLVTHARRTNGRLVNVMMERGGDASEVVAALRRGGVPKRLSLSEALNLRGDYEP